MNSSSELRNQSSIAAVYVLASAVRHATRAGSLSGLQALDTLPRLTDFLKGSGVFFCVRRRLAASGSTARRGHPHAAKICRRYFTIRISPTMTSSSWADAAIRFASWLSLRTTWAQRSLSFVRPNRELSEHPCSLFLVTAAAVVNPDLHALLASGLRVLAKTGFAIGTRRPSCAERFGVRSTV